MIIARPQRPGGPDPLLGHEWDDLRFVTPYDEAVIVIPAPKDGWTYAALKAAEPGFPLPTIWDVFLADQWVGWALS